MRSFHVQICARAGTFDNCVHRAIYWFVFCFRSFKLKRRIRAYSRIMHVQSYELTSVDNQSSSKYAREKEKIIFLIFVRLLVRLNIS